MLGMPVILGGFSIPQSLSFLEGSSYTKNNGYLGVIMDASGTFHHRTQLIDALIESCTALFNHLGRPIKDLGGDRDAKRLRRLEVYG